MLLHGYDLDAPAKRDIALDLIEQAWSDLDRAAISVQVLQEFFVNVFRRGHSPGRAATLAGDFSHWQVIDNSLALFKLGIALQDRFRLSLWDAMIPGWMKHQSVNPDYWKEKNMPEGHSSIPGVKLEWIPFSSKSFRGKHAFRTDTLAQTKLFIPVFASYT